MPKQRRKRRPPKRSLALPDLEQTKSAVLNSLTSKSGQRTYDHAINEFVDWYCSEPRLSFNRTVVLRYRIHLEQRHLAGWWFHLRRCAECGHIGCCDSSPGQHASKHAAATGHPIIASFEPGEHWFYDYETRGMIDGVELLPPHSHPLHQPVPGPAGRVPANWESLLH